jgi:predicted nucleic acid-binding protein
VPSLWQEGYANVLSKLAREEKRAIEEIIEHFNYTVKELKQCELEIDNQKALRVSLEYKISVYDSHFIVLAIEFNTVTYYRRFGKGL